jgi:lipopolysaccharide transport system ATP-binding protein
MSNSKKISTKEKETEIAISVKGVSKTFRIPHEKISSVKGAVLGAFKQKSYEEFKALDDVSFEVKKGEFFGIIGRNGSGKSTLLKVLAGIYQADKGKVEINGMISPFLELGIGFNPELSGRDNVYLNATVLGMTKKQIDEKFDSIMKFSELERFIDQKLKNYSSGMQVRLAFSVSIHANRDILLMDEVLAVGDSNFQSKCLTEFNKYRDMGRTVVIVTHDISVVERYCDRAMLLRKGRIEKIGKADEVANAYVFQNMSDEEKRLVVKQKESKNKTEKDKKELEKNGAEEKGNKVAEITDVKFLDKEGKEKNVFETGDAVDIKICYKVNKSIERINFGLGMHSESIGQLFGYTTQADNYDAYKTYNFIILRIKKLPILKGEYFINVSCFRNAGEVCYDFRPKYKFLKIYSKGVCDSYVGFVSIDHKWVQG